jgi:hypothetical protein
MIIDLLFCSDNSLLQIRGLERGGSSARISEAGAGVRVRGRIILEDGNVNCVHRVSESPDRVRSFGMEDSAGHKTFTVGDKL